MHIRGALLYLFVLMNMLITQPLCAQGPSAAPCGSVHVRITNVRSARGDVKILLFLSADGFPEDHTRSFSKAIIAPRGGEVECSFNDVPSGVYAVSAFHDENLNMKLDRHWWGKPKEGVALSNDADISFREPKFEDAQFEFSSAEQTMIIKMRY